MGKKESVVNIGMNPDFLPFLKENNTNSVVEDVNLSLAIYFYTARKLTLAKAAELCNKSLSDFIEVLIEHNIHWAEYTEEQKKQDDETIGFILREDEKNVEGDM